MELYHHGIKGQHWGIRNGPPYPLSGRQNMYKFYANMSKHMRYDDTDHALQSPIVTKRKQSGNCHDQVLYEMEELKKFGYNPKARFIMEGDSKTGQGGVTHSYVYFKDGKDYIWFENAWKDQAGLKRYKTEKELNDDVLKKFKDAQHLPDTYTGKFDTRFIRPGDSLQDIVNACVGKKTG